MVFRHISPDMKQQALKLLQDGWDMEEIVDALGVSSKSIGRWIGMPTAPYTATAVHLTVSIGFGPYCSTAVFLAASFRGQLGHSHSSATPTSAKPENAI